MKSSVPLLLVLLAAAPAPAAEFLLEAESFADPGGWVIDQQFVDLMGSPYLLAHGMGIPVANAVTTAPLPAPGTYRVWVRTKDWVPGHAGPGTFRVLIDGSPLAQIFGDADPAWAWQDGGMVTLSAATVAVALEDQTGFAARCDAIYFTTDLEAVPPGDPVAMAPWRRALLGLPDTPPVEGDFDLVVVGGGIAGCGAAIAAARLGLSVALIHDRPFLGGNASQEVRVHTLGETDRIVDEIDTAHYANGDAQAAAYDARRHAVVDNEPNIALYLRWQAYGVEMSAGRIVAVLARHTGTGQERRFRAPHVVDSTGDGWIGFWAGASYRTGREASSEYGESLAPAAADNLKMGTSLLWNSIDTATPQPFPDVPWAMDVAKDYTATAGEWFWEYGIHPDLDTIADAETIRDHLFRAIYGSFWNAKQLPANANHRLLWVGYVGGKRESRRILGDHVLIENDVRNPPGFPDGVVHESREIDLHFQQGGAYDFLSTAQYTPHGQFWIPFRCLYSKDVPNLMMAGRCFSASHVGLGSPRVMRTCGQMGVAVGSAAYVCAVFGLDPRGVYQQRLAELLAVVEEGADGTLLRQEIDTVDNQDPDATVTGAWSSSTYNTGYYGADYIHDGNTGKGTKSVRFTPTIPEAGTYSVYIRYTASSNRATNVPVDIVHAGGTTPVVVNETINGGQWVLLGAWAFDAGASGSVLVRTDGTNGYVIADAIRIARATVHPPCILPAAGTYAGAVSVRLSCFTRGAEIRYTTDGSDPDEASPLYTGAFDLLRSATVKARAWKSGCRPSTIASAAFTIAPTGLDVPVRDGYTLLALPLEPVAPMKASDLVASLGDSGIACTRVLRYNGTGYEIHTAGGGGANFDIVPGAGYFVRCTNAGLWRASGYRFDRAAVPLGLETGYNLVGLPLEPSSPARYTATVAVAEIGAQGGEATRVLRYDGTGYEIHTAGGGGANFSLSPGEGYFIRCTKASTWTVTK